MSHHMIRVLVVVVGVLLCSAAAGVFWGIVDGRRGKHVAPMTRSSRAAPVRCHAYRCTYIDRFYAPRLTLWIGRPQPRPQPSGNPINAAQAFANIAANNPDLHHVGQACADLYLIPEER